jgi:hypothetical protein
LYGTRCDQVCQFSPGTPVFSSNITDRHDITEILLKVALNTIKPNYNTYHCMIAVWEKIHQQNMIELLGYGSFTALSTIFQIYFTDIRKPVSE